MADKVKSMKDTVDDINASYTVKRIIERHQGPSVLVCDPVTHKSVALIIPVDEWDNLARVHNETVEELEDLEDKIEELEYSREIRDLADKDLANLLGEVMGVKRTLEPRDYMPYRPYESPADPTWENKKFYDKNLNKGEVEYPEAYSQDGTMEFERKNLQSRVSEQRKQISLLVEQARGRKKEISYWKAVAQANLDTLNHYGIKPPKIKAVKPESADGQGFKAVGGYL